MNNACPTAYEHIHVHACPVCEMTHNSDSQFSTSRKCHYHIYKAVWNPEQGEALAV